MTALKLIVTAAGRAALSNAARDGTGPTRIAFVGVTATSFNPLPTTLVIPDEIKRIATISGGAVAADTLHVTIRDDSTDTYSVRGIGLYLADGTLFAVYSQATDLLSKSIQATMLLAGDVQFADIDAAALTFGDTNFQMSLATTEVTGVVRLATDPETITGTNGQLAITPKGLLAALNARLGAAAPSAFVKTLLDKVSALAFVTALGIRGAASYDIGHGNGLDADQLDGQHGAYYRDYRNLTNVPESFPPAVHRTDWSTIDNVPAFAQRWATWAEVTGKPVTFTPSPHSHAITDVNGLPAALDGLSATIATKAPKDAPLFTGLVTIYQDLVASSGALVFGAGTGIGKNGAIYLRPDGTGSGLGALFVARDGITWDNKTVWHAGNFDPAGKASLTGAEFSGDVSARFILCKVPNNGYAQMNPSGAPGVAGFLSFHESSGLRRGYMGNNANGRMEIAPEQGDHVVIGGPVVELVALAASGAITGATIRATGTIMAAGGFQVG